MAPIPVRKRVPPRTELRKVAMRKSEKSRIGCGTRRQCQTSTAIITAPKASRPSMLAEGPVISVISIEPSIRAESAKPERRKPQPSKRPTGRGASRGRRASASPRQRRPMGMLIRKIQCQG